MVHLDPVRSRRIQLFLLLGLLFLHSGPRAAYTFLDSFFWLPREASSRALQERDVRSGFVLVTVDEQDLRAFPDIWPWNRRRVAEVLAALDAGGIRGVGLCVDLQLEYPRRKDPGQDQVLAEAFDRSVPVVYLGSGPGGALARRSAPPIELFCERLAGWGRIQLIQDVRGQLTHLGLGVPPEGPTGQDKVDRGDAAEALGVLLGRAGDRGGRDYLGSQLDGRGALRIPFHLHRQVPAVSVRKLLAGKVPRRKLEGRVALLGASATVLHDIYDTPVAGNMPAVEALGLSLEGALRKELLRDLPPVLDGLLVLCVCLLVVVGARRTSPGRLAAGVLAGSMLYTSAVILVHALRGFFLPLSRPLGLALLVLLLEVLRQRSEVQSDFFVTDPLVEREARQLMDSAMSTMARGDYEQALREFAEITVMETVLRARAEHRLVLALLALERVQEAEMLVGSLDFDKLGEEEIYLLARELEARDLGKVARKVFEKLYLIDPDFQDVRDRLAELRHKLSGFSEDELVETIARRILDRRFVGAELFNKGGGGFLFRVQDRMRPREALVLKILSPLQMNDPLVVRRFLREARSVKALKHPALIRVFDVFEASLPYYTMEFVEARSLMEVLQEEGPLPPRRALPLLLQACDGVAHAHAAGLVHRDLKPHNLLVDAEDRVKVIDFGVARVLGSEDTAASARLSGTPLYMSPEQARGEPTSPASDLYSLGLVLHEALYLGLPFGTMQARLEGPAPRPPETEEVPEELVDLLMKALERDPRARPPSLETWAGELSGWLASQEGRLPGQGAP